MLKVYVLTHEPYHDISSVQGVYFTLEEAKAAAPEGEVFIASRSNYYSIADSDYYSIIVKELSSADPLKQFALAVLAGDPMALDAATDALTSPR